MPPAQLGSEPLEQLDPLRSLPDSTELSSSRTCHSIFLDLHLKLRRQQKKDAALRSESLAKPFSRFPILPTELRLKIWEEAISITPRVIEMQSLNLIHAYSWHVSSVANRHPMTLACKESALVYTKNTIKLPAHSALPKLRYNPNIDTLFIGPTCGMLIRNNDRPLSLPTLSRSLSTLAVDSRWTTLLVNGGSGHISINPDRPYIIHHKAAEWLDQFPHLDSFIVVYSNWNCEFLEDDDGFFTLGRKIKGIVGLVDVPSERGGAWETEKGKAKDIFVLVDKWIVFGERLDAYRKRKSWKPAEGGEKVHVEVKILSRGGTLLDGLMDN